MSEDNSVGGMQFAFGKANTPDVKQNESGTLPVEETDSSKVADIYSNSVEEPETEDLTLPYTDERSISISLVKSFSLYRKANDKVLPKKKDYIGSSVSASRILSSNKEEIEAYFPNIVGLAPNNPDFISRIKAYLNNIRVGVDEMGLTLNNSFVYNTKADYYRIKAEEERIEETFKNVNRTTLKGLKTGLKDKILKLNVLESTKHKYGYPVNMTDYLMYRHCLLYDDVAKDVTLINSDSSIRFYFKDDQKEADKLRKFRTEINRAKVNYVRSLEDNEMFDSIYAQYLSINNYPVIAGLNEGRIDREMRLDKFSTDEPVKFNKLFNDKDVKLIGAIELLIAHGELQRSLYNQNISNSDGQFIGANMREAVAWFKSNDNISTVNAYFNKLKNI